MGLDGVFHLHGLKHEEDLAFGNLLAFFYVDLDHRTLHWGGNRIAGNGSLGAGTLALFLFPWGAVDTEGRGEGYLDTAAVDFYGVYLGRLCLGSLGISGIIVGGKLVIPFLLDPLGVDTEVAVFCGESWVSNDRLVKRDNGGQALNRVLG